MTSHLNHLIEYVSVQNSQKLSQIITKYSLLPRALEIYKMVHFGDSEEKMRSICIILKAINMVSGNVVH